MRHEKLAAALDAHTARVADSALGEAASAVLESTGEPGAGAAATGTMMSESEVSGVALCFLVTASRARGSLIDNASSPPVPTTEAVAPAGPWTGSLGSGRVQGSRRLSAGERLLIHGDLPPVFFRQRRSFADRHLQRLAGAAGDETLAAAAAPVA